MAGRAGRPRAKHQRMNVIAVNTISKTMPEMDQGLSVLVALLRFHGLAADPAQLRHRFGNFFGVPEMLRCAKELGLKARCYRTNWKRLAATPLPGIVVLRDGGFMTHVPRLNVPS